MKSFNSPDYIEARRSVNGGAVIVREPLNIPGVEVRQLRELIDRNPLRVEQIAQHCGNLARAIPGQFLPLLRVRFGIRNLAQLGAMASCIMFVTQ